MINIAPLFTRPDGQYAFARWRRPWVPVIFGVADESLPVFKGAIEVVAALAGQSFAETDPDQGANFMLFVLRDWDELLQAPEVIEMIPELSAAVPRLQAQQATAYRLFRFESDGAIRACFAFLCLAGETADQPADALALDQAVRAILPWADGAVTTTIATSVAGLVVHPDMAGVIRAAYDPVLPDVAHDPSHALRVAARVARG